MKRIEDIHFIPWVVAHAQLDADHQAVRDKIAELEAKRDSVETYLIGIYQANTMRLAYNFAIETLEELLDGDEIMGKVCPRCLAKGDGKHEIIRLPEGTDWGD